MTWNVASHSVTNPDMQSERRLLAQLAPEMDEDMIRRLVAAFQDLRRGYDEGSRTHIHYEVKINLSCLFWLETDPDPT